MGMNAFLFPNFILQFRIKLVKINWYDRSLAKMSVYLYAYVVLLIYLYNKTECIVESRGVTQLRYTLHSIVFASSVMVSSAATLVPWFPT